MVCTSKLQGGRLRSKGAGSRLEVEHISSQIQKLGSQEDPSYAWILKF